MNEPLEIRARTRILKELETLQTDVYTDYHGEIDDDVYDALQAEIYTAICNIREIKL